MPSPPEESVPVEHQSDLELEQSPRVFISYSWDSPEHLDDVLALADRLRSEGIDANLDQYEPSPPEGWPQWMARQIRTSDFVLVVCTEIYLRRWNGEESPGKGHGVRWESLLAVQALYNQGSLNSKLIPVLFESGKFEDIPIALQGTTFYQTDQEAGYEKLYRHLTRQPYTEKPKLGKRRELPPRERKSEFASILPPNNEVKQQEYIEALVRRLHDIGISQDDWEKAYQFSLDATTSDTEHKFTPQQMVEDLVKNWNIWKLNESDNQIPPLLEFVLRLTHKRIESKEDFVVVVEKIMGIDEGKLNLVAKEFIRFLNRENWPSYYILVDIDQISQEPSKYSIAIYSGKRANRVGQEKYDFKARRIDEIYYTENEVKNAFMKMLDEEIAEKKQLPELIEFVLPFEMLHLGIDEWSKEVENDAAKSDPFLAIEEEVKLAIGRKYPVVIRPQIKIPDEAKYEALRQTYWGNLRRRWQSYINLAIKENAI